MAATTPGAKTPLRALTGRRAPAPTPTSISRAAASSPSCPTEPSPSTRHFPGPGGAAGRKGNDGCWARGCLVRAPSLPPASRGGGPRALLTHDHLPSYPLGPDPRSQTQGALGSPSSGPDVAAGLLGHRLGRTKLPGSQKPFCGGPLGSACPPWAQLRMEVAGQEGRP